MGFDDSRAGLYHPERMPVFVGHEVVPAFDPAIDGYSAANTWWLAQCAHLAYYDCSRYEAELESAGLTLETSFDDSDTQGFIARGSGFAVLAFRGTEADEWHDILTDVKVRLVPCEAGGRVHLGFKEALDSVWDRHVLPVIESLDVPVWFTGHSLGGALATLAAAYRAPRRVVSFASPRTGDEAFAVAMASVKHDRCVYCCDVVARMPPEVISYRHCGTMQLFASSGLRLEAPDARAYFWTRAWGRIKYRLSFPLLRGAVLLRGLADHSILNYEGAARSQMSTRQG